MGEVSSEKSFPYCGRMCRLLRRRSDYCHRSAAAKLFIDEKYGHVYRGGGGLELLVQTSLLYKSLFGRYLNSISVP